MHAYAQENWKSFCYIWQFLDLFITLLCVAGFVLTFHETLSNSLGETFCDILFIFRDALILGKITSVFVYKKTPDNESLQISLNLMDEDELFGRSFSIARIKYRFRPTMDTLFEQDEEDEDDLVKNFRCLHSN